MGYPVLWVGVCFACGLRFGMGYFCGVCAVSFSSLPFFFSFSFLNLGCVCLRLACVRPSFLGGRCGFLLIPFRYAWLGLGLGPGLDSGVTSPWLNSGTWCPAVKQGSHIHLSVSRFV